MNPPPVLITLPLTPMDARVLVEWLRDQANLAVMCRGYGEDEEAFTELVWPDDRNLDFEAYPEFQLWISPNWEQSNATHSE